MKKFSKFVLLTSASAICASIPIYPATANAQLNDTSQQEVAGQEDDNTIIVTATRRPESIQDVPVSVSSFGSEEISDTGSIDIADISTYVPNFEFSDASILPNLYVRGIGSGTTHSIEQSVGRFIDEVYIGRAAINLHPLFDVGNVEVLRGPQGTLFGKNTIAGAVIINTKDPTNSFEGGFDAYISDYSTVGGSWGGEAFLSGPIGDSAGFRIAALYRDRDGFIENRLPGPDGGTREDFGLRGKLQFDIGPNTTIDLKGEFLTFDEEGQTPSEVTSSIFPGGPFAGQPVPESFFQRFSPNFSFDRDWKSDYDCTAVLNGRTFCPNRNQDTYNATLEINHEFEGLGTLTSVSAYQSVEFFHQFLAIEGGVTGGGLRATRNEQYEGFTQELRLTSEEFETFDFIVGGYFETSEVTRLQFDDFDVATFFGGGPVNSLIEDWSQDTKTAALFGQVRWRFSDEWSAIFGGRWSYEEKDFSFFRRVGAGGADPAVLRADPGTGPNDFISDLNRDENRFTPSVTLRWEPNPDLTIFASASQGHKTGGFSDRPEENVAGNLEISEFSNELNTAFELGAKGVFGPLQVNAAAFYMLVEDLQVARALPGQFTTQFQVQNAAEATVWGVELDATVELSENWTLGGNVAYTNARYDDFPGASENCPTIGGALEPDPLTGDILCNYAGLPLIFAPDWKGAAYIALDQPDFLGEWDLGFRADVNFSSEYFVELEYVDVLRQGSYATFNANVSLTTPGDELTISLIGKNLTEEHVLAWGLQAGPGTFVAPNEPREMILRLSYRF
ncbi:Outer membrane receptor proteins, mostly Fe transport [Parasphingorhabdus marina DSM 22363]|uniref:Outer membrane receptor proteins, mostly Fe transport n=1 Tax=Parasphingorhabdus marina DSM 22363 TaxID=1123272 RepID=A0A1N6DA60_9SPHN|nr:TonB-dependent receptor [Parasphingorhabdus marina]SIN67685.1 Outer membrane receptor proteins, mostly Fe transport [Parasphingorhabdus marina DSM 22363]